MRRVVYLMSGAAHLPYLVVSLKNLRKHYNGEIYIYAWPESLKQVVRITNDFRIDASCFSRTPVYRGKNDQFFDKLSIMRELPDGPNLYLDADTMPMGSLDFLFEKAEQYKFCATQFSNWRSCVGQARFRVSRLNEYNHIPRMYIHQSIQENHPSLNGGVFACLPNSQALKNWKEWTEPCLKSLFIADETVLHTIARKYEPCRELFIAPGLYNMSPKQKWWPGGIQTKDIKLFHFHGDSNTRPDKSLFGFHLWWPEWLECQEENFGFCNEWKHTVDNKYLDRCMENEKNTLSENAS